MNIRIAVLVCGVVLVALGVSWLYVFGFTDYRAHLRIWGLFLGGLTAAVGLHLLIWALVRSFWAGE